jgi:AraC family transcriptional regulator
MTDKADVCEGSQKDSNHNRTIERVILSMHDGLDSEMSLEDMSRAAFISPFHFNRIFRKAVGIPSCHFLSALRIQAAKRLLASTEERIIDVCLDSRLHQPRHLSRRFKELVGLAPRKFRRLAVGAMKLPLSSRLQSASGELRAGQ